MVQHLFLRKEVVPKGTVPFDGIYIEGRTQKDEDEIAKLQIQFDEGKIDVKTVESILTRMQIDGHIDIEDITLRGGIGMATGARPRY